MLINYFQRLLELTKQLLITIFIDLHIHMVNPMKKLLIIHSQLLINKGFQMLFHFRHGV